jgi:hypothetical protein
MVRKGQTGHNRLLRDRRPGICPAFRSRLKRRSARVATNVFSPGRYSPAQNQGSPYYTAGARPVI